MANAIVAVFQERWRKSIPSPPFTREIAAVKGRAVDATEKACIHQVSINQHDSPQGGGGETVGPQERGAEIKMDSSGSSVKENRLLMTSF